MAETLQVNARQEGGKHNTRRLRRGGQTPAILYGHGLENVCLAVPSDQLESTVRHGSRLVSLAGAVNESAFIRDLQWDTYGTHILHVDLTRISADELVTVELPIELRGEAPGVKAGGVIEHLLHQVEIECPASAIPDRLYVRVNRLNLDESIKLSQLELPEKAKAFGDPDTVIVQCVIPVERPEEELAGAAGAEPEVIGGKKEEEGEEE